MGRAAEIAAAIAVAATALPAQSSRAVTCDSNIVSATVVESLCAHRDDKIQVMDALIFWRRSPGWFQPRGDGTIGGGGGGNAFGGVSKGYVYRYSTYGDTTIAFEADFDAGTMKIDGRMFDLSNGNTIFVDRVEEPAERRAYRVISTATRLDTIDDVNVWIARHSHGVFTFLQCATSMPKPATPFPLQQPKVITVCEKLRSR